MRPWRLAALAALVAARAAVCLAIYVFAWLGETSGEDGTVRLTIPAGSNARAVGSLLEQEGVLERGWLFARVLRLTGAHRELKAGEYEFELPVAPVEVMRILHEGRIATVPLTIPEGLERFEIAALLAGEGIADEMALLAAFDDPAPIADLDPAAENLEGYLFPETYRFARDTDPRFVATTLVGLFRERFAEPHADEIAARGLSLRELVTLASLVEKETGLPEERGAIAGVYADRLDRGMLMQCDPTIIYALKLVGRWDGDIRRRDLTWDHPYNTYVRPGLPPGPIASPGLDALLAALRPERTGALYFVARGDGGHAFSRTLAEHNRNVRRYQLRR